MREFFSNIRLMGGFDGPARVSRATGELHLNKNEWHKLSDDKKDFIMAHELGHYLLNTNSEFKADEFADYLHQQRGLSLKASIDAMTRFLDPNDPSHQERVKRQLLRVLNRDAQAGNQKAKQILDRLNNTGMDNMNLMQARLASGDEEEPMNEFIFKKNKAKQQAKIDRKNARTDLIKAKAEAKREYAKQGIVEPKTDWTKIAGGVVGTAAKMFIPGLPGIPGLGDGGTDTSNTQTNTVQDTTPPEKKDNKFLVIGIVVVVVVVITIVAVVILKRNKNKK